MRAGTGALVRWENARFGESQLLLYTIDLSIVSVPVSE